jgi:hypothetical protein
MCARLLNSVSPLLSALHGEGGVGQKVGEEVADEQYLQENRDEKGKAHPWECKSTTSLFLW